MIVDVSKLNSVAKDFFLGGCTLPETKGSHLKIDGWNTSFLSG